VAPKIAFFAVTNRCHHRCVSCDIWAQPPVEPSIESLLAAIDRLHALGVRVLMFTGGETTLYKKLPVAIAHATRLGMFSQLPTNGHRVTRQLAAAYRDAGLAGLGISMEHFRSDVLDKNRGHVGVGRHILESLVNAKAEGLAVSSYVLISRLNSGELEQIARHHMAAGFDGVNFCFPMSDMGSTFELGGARSGDPSSVTFSRDELLEQFRTVQRLKKDPALFIYNPEESLELAIDFVEGRPTRFPCTGGSRIFWVDWNLDAFLCPKKSVKLGPLLSLEKLPSEPGCDQCLFQGFRDLSIYLQGFQSLGPWKRLVTEHLRGGKFRIPPPREQPAASA
jgi:MoaA/NifB/PqqE/SkfB family radical SAM enzyme